MTKPKRFIRRPELLRKVGLSNTQIFYLERSGQMPRHILLTPRCAVWDEAEIEAWMASRMAKPANAAKTPTPPTRRSAQIAEVAKDGIT
jgi:prophage regulatory protein